MTSEAKEDQVQTKGMGEHYMKAQHGDIHAKARGARRLLQRAVSGLVAAALLSSAIVSMGGEAAFAAPVATVESAPFVSATPTEQSGGCTLNETRATKRWWMFGYGPQLDFGAKGTAAPKVGSSTGKAAEGSTVVTDTQGNLRFWSNGIDVWGADGQPIKNSGGGLGMNSSAQTVVAMPAIGAPGKYFVVTSGYQSEMGTAKAVLYYSVIDMNANNGLGEMTQKNIVLGTPGVAGEGLAATPNAAGDGFWVYSVASNSNAVYRWQFKANGPVSKTPQAQNMTDTVSSYSTIHFDTSIGSNQGVELAANLNIYTMLTINRTTGLLTEGFRVKHTPASGSGSLYGAAFSPSGRYMFFSELYGAPSHVYRVDLQTTNTPAQLRDSRIDLGATQQTDGWRYGGAVQLGPDGNIWANDGYGMPTLIKIPNPDAATPGAMQRLRIDASAGVATGWGLPDMVTGCEKRVPQMTATVSAPANLTLGNAVDPVTVTVTNTGNTVLTNISASSTGLNTCPQSTLAPNDSMTCTAKPGTWGPVTQAQNDQGVVQGIAYPLSAKGSIGADPSTGLDRIVTITVSPTMDLTLLKTFKLTFDGNGGSINGVTFINRTDGSTWGALPSASKSANIFIGWFTAKTGGVQIVSSTVARGYTVAYAQWRPARFNVVFDGNAQTGVVSGSTASITVDAGCTSCTLPANGFTKTTGALALIQQGSNEKAQVNSKFLGWSLDQYSHSGDIGDQSVAGALSQTDGATVKLYAVWDDAPQFIVQSYPNRFFTLTEAKAGAITEAALLATVKVTDKETNPLEHKTSAQVQSSGNDVGLTLYDYSASDFTSLTDSGVVTVTYKVKDGVGNVAFLRIRVTVSNGDPLTPDALTYLRGISPQYADKGAAAGGLSTGSLWQSDPTRKLALAQAMDGSAATTYCLSPAAIAQLRSQVANDGLGNSQTSDGLAASVKVLHDDGSCS